MSVTQKTAAAGILVLLAATAYGLWYTNEPARATAKPAMTTQSVDASTGVDQRAFALTQRLKPLAEGSEEQNLAETAERLADHRTESFNSGSARPGDLAVGTR